jgi:DNA invertase Pin-like site-specific DNA recombinase
MTEVLYSPKIKPEHLARKAIVYLRQSSERQVRQNKESQILQYAVAERVRALGWKQVEIINSDLGSSAGIASAQREGFERVLSSVALGEVGIVGSREVSRLSRTDKDWCRLLEVCQIFGTLIADEQQVYDLNYLDDQLVAGHQRDAQRRRAEGHTPTIARGAGVQSAPRRTVQKTAGPDWWYF